MTNTFTFQPGFTWRKVGFLLYSDSLAYRDVIEANPGWDISSSPPVGSTLNRPTSPSIPGLTLPPAVSSGYSEANPETFFPFESREEYIKAVARYSPSALLDVEVVNGYSATSDRVLSYEG